MVVCPTQLLSVVEYYCLFVQSLTSEKSVSSTSTCLRPQRATRQIVSSRHVLKHSQSMPTAAAAEEELLTIAGASAMRPDSSMSKDATESPDSATPRSSTEIRSRPRRIDLGLPHSSRPTSRLTAGGSSAADSPSSAADSPGSVARPTRSGSLVRRAVVAAAAVQGTTPPNVDERLRQSSGDVGRRVGWSHDCSDGQSATRGYEQRHNVDPLDIRPSRGSDENGNSRATRRNSPGTAANRAASCRVRSAMPPPRQQQAQQRQPPTTAARPSTTSRTRAAQLTMTKSVSQPSFLAMLVSGTAVPRPRDAGPAAGTRDHVTAGIPSRTAEDNIIESTAKNDDDNNNNTNEDNNDDDDDDEMKRQWIEDWLQHLETVVLDRPSSPVIDEDVPPQTDTAIHVVYDGD